MNTERKKAGLSELKMDKELLNAAMMRAAETALDFSHTRPDGGDCFSICDKMSGENIAVGQSTPKAVMNSWMNSSGHKANILGSSYKSIGIGCFTQGGMLYWVQCFSGQSATSVKQPADKKVTVKVGVSLDTIGKGKITFRSSDYNVKVGKSTTMELRVDNPGFPGTVCELDASNFTWKSSNTKVAAISSKGKLKGISTGKFTITVTLKVAPYTKITYKGKVTGINLTNPKASVKAKKGKNTVTWKKSSKAVGYYVYRKVGNGKWKKIKTIKKKSTVKYIDKKVKKGKKYQYKIVAYKGRTKVTSKTKQIKAK